MTLAFILVRREAIGGFWTGVMDLTLVLLEHTQGEQQLGGYYKNLHIRDGDLEQDGVGEKLRSIKFWIYALKYFILWWYMLNINLHHFLGYSSFESSHQCLPFSKKHIIFCQCISFSKPASRCDSWAWGSQQWGNGFYLGCVRKHFDLVHCKHVWSIFLCLDICKVIFVINLIFNLLCD